MLWFLPITTWAHYPNQPEDIYKIQEYYPVGAGDLVEGDLSAMIGEAYAGFQRLLQHEKEGSGYLQGHPLPCPGWEIITSGQCIADSQLGTTHVIRCNGGSLRGTWCNSSGHVAVDYQNWKLDQAYAHLRPGAAPCNPDDPQTETSKGNPCDAATGNKSERVEDYSDPGSGLSLVRYYNSLEGGWRHNYDRRITVRNKNPEVPADAYASVYRENGYPDQFWQGWTPARPNSRTTLTQTADGGWIYTKADGGTEHYDSQGRLIQEIDRAGRTTATLAHYADRIVVTGPYGHSLTLTQDANGRLSALIDPAGTTRASYAYDAEGNLSSVVYADGSGRIYHYEKAELPHHLTGVSIVHSVGNVLRYSSFDYDVMGRAILTEHAQTDNTGPQERFSFSYDSDIQTTVTDAAGNSEIFTFSVFNGVKKLTSHQYPDLRSSTKSYNSSTGNMTSERDPAGNTVNYVYNTSNQRIGKTEAQGNVLARTTTYQYLSPSIDLPTVIESPSVYAGSKKTTTTTYDANNRATAITQRGFTSGGQPVERTVTLSYTASGQVEAIDGPRTDVNDVTTFSYYDCATVNECGQLQALTNALGQVTRFEAYDANGRLLQMTDTNGLETLLAYDVLGRLSTTTERTQAGEIRTTQYSYDASGNLAQAVYPDGYTLHYAYDAAQDLRSVTDSEGNRIVYGYDIKGNRTAEYTSDPYGNLARSIGYTYNSRDFVTAVNQGGSLTQYTLNAIGNPTKVIDPNNNPDGPSYAYDVLKRIKTITKASQYTILTYDVNDRLASMRAPNYATTQYRYDDLGNLEREVSPDRGAITYTYDTAGNVRTMMDARGITTTYTYDALNRLTSVQYPDSTEDVAFVYDQAPGCILGAGRLCRVTDASGTTSYSYDAFGNVASQTFTTAGIGYVTHYRYDARDRLIEMTYPNGRIVGYDRNAAGRVTQVTTEVGGQVKVLASNLLYRPDGLFTSLTFGNSVAESRQYDTRGLLLYQFVGTADTRVYGYDANGNLTSKQTLPETASYIYDTRDWLTEDRGSSTVAYAYNQNGNRIKRTEGTATFYTYTSSTNRLTKVGTDVLTLDDAGNTIAFGAKSYTYNQTGQLATAGEAGTTQGSYVYNYLRQRTQKTTSAGTTVYHHDLQGNLLSETTANGTLIRAYVYLPLDGISLPLAQIDKAAPTETITYLHTDHLQTPRIGTDAVGNPVWRWEGGAFGGTAPNEDPDQDGSFMTVNLRFPGQYYDAESGLFCAGSRYYSPALGRYISADRRGIDEHVQNGLDEMYGQLEIDFNDVDSIEDLVLDPERVIVEINPYAYVINNPLKWIDPDGFAHRKGKRESTRGKHEQGEARQKRDQGGEKGDKNRRSPANNRPKGWKGPYPARSPGWLAPLIDPIIREHCRMGTLTGWPCPPPEDPLMCGA